MTSPNLLNLAKIEGVHPLAPTPQELANLLGAGSAKLQDAQKRSNSLTSRFDLVYNAAHSLALAALRHHGFRSKNRTTVFQVLPLTVGFPNGETRVLMKAHGDRNLMEYEGEGEVDPNFLDEVIQATTKLELAVRVLLK